MMRFANIILISIAEIAILTISVLTAIFLLACETVDSFVNGLLDDE